MSIKNHCSLLKNHFIPRIRTPMPRVALTSLQPLSQASSLCSIPIKYGNKGKERRQVTTETARPEWNRDVPAGISRTDRI